MFGFGRARREAIEEGAAAARLAIAPFWDSMDGAFDGRIWKDPYVLGIIGGSIFAQTIPATGRKLSAADRGSVILNAMLSLGVPQEACDLGLNLVEHRDSEYSRGHNDALAAFLVMAGALKAEAYDDPDIVIAKGSIRGMRKLNREAALAGVAVGKLDENQELGLAYIFLKVSSHKEAHYPSLD